MEKDSTVKVRPEMVADYPAIAMAHLAAFGKIKESLIVALLRQEEEFDPELSLVIEVGGKVAGHALFMPRRVQLLGQTVRVVNLAPIAVLPEYQKRGLGGKLIEAGHNIARDKGYAFSFLLGHPTYYPRLGYLQSAFGDCSLKISFDPSQPVPGLPELDARPVQDGDVSTLYRLWQENVTPDVDFALDPGQALINWISPDPTVEALAYLDETGKVVGYTRFRTSTFEKPIMFLAKDKAAARSMIAMLARRRLVEDSLLNKSHASAVEFELPLHPLSKLAAVLPGQPQSRTGPYWMAYPLLASVFDEYHSQVLAGKRPPGYVVWPPAFDLS